MAACQKNIKLTVETKSYAIKLPKLSDVKVTFIFTPEFGCEVDIRVQVLR